MRQPQIRPLPCTKRYDAFGNLTSSSGSWNGPFSYGGAFGYQTETDTGYQLLGHRYYDPTTGRFLTRDPIGDGRNWYTYCANNPINAADPTGLYRLIVWGNSDGVFGAGLAGWYMMPSAKSGDVVVRGTIGKKLFLALMINAEEFYFFGHGTPDGGLMLEDGTVITPADLRMVADERRRRGKGKMRVAKCLSCFSGRFASTIKIWLDMALEFSGYPDVTASEYPPRINPLETWKSPTKVDPGAPLGSKDPDMTKKDEAEKRRKRTGKGKGGKNL